MNSFFNLTWRWRSSMISSMRFASASLIRRDNFERSSGSVDNSAPSTRRSFWTSRMISLIFGFLSKPWPRQGWNWLHQAHRKSPAGDHASEPVVRRADSFRRCHLFWKTSYPSPLHILSDNFDYRFGVSFGIRTISSIVRAFSPRPCA